MNPEIATDSGLQILPLPAFRDNYIWLLRCGQFAALVDPGEASVALATLAAEGLALVAILLTHHHQDHVGGVEEIQRQLPSGSNIPVFGPKLENISCVNRPLIDGERVDLPEFQLSFEVIAVPGHTRGHIAYYGRKLLGCGALFCGDTLFACGCGRLFEGTPLQMWQSLGRLAALPAATRVYCAHEYTAANIRFALAVEPDNCALVERAAQVGRLREADLPTVPSTIGLELATNPFLRCELPSLLAAAENHSGRRPPDAAASFAAIRAWKDKF